MTSLTVEGVGSDPFFNLSDILYAAPNSEIPGDRSMRIASVYESKSSINCIKPFYPINIAKLPPRILGYGIVPEDTSFHLFQLLCC